MEASLVDLILHQTAVVLPKIIKYLSQYPFQRIIPHRPPTGSIGIFYRFIAIVAKVESGAIAMATVLGGVGIMTTKLLHVVLAAHHTGDNHLMKRDSLMLKTVEEVAADVLQQDGSTGNEIGLAVAQTIDVEIKLLPT